ncbi:MAG: hypothetical protein GY758_08465 [Fuerstiella sp.]|nr:hypothetical protein [Fuerstiella sp.]MCP4506575.1 hypothetical protein [Fuerstiella sp.]
MSSVSIASIDELTSLLELMLGTDVSAKAVESPMEADSSKVVGVYASDDGTVVSAYAVDLTLANYIGAAFSMIPPGAAQDNASVGTLPDNAFDNLGEILNVSVNLTKVSDSGHVSFRNAIHPEDEIPDDVAAILSSEANRLDVKIEIQRYGAGLMTLCALSESAVPAA